MWNFVSAIGNCIEFVGLGFLTYELWRTTKASLSGARELAAEKRIGEMLYVEDGKDTDAKPGIYTEGGLTDRLLQRIAGQEQEIKDRARLLAGGAGLSALGALVQIVGGFGQAFGG